MKKLMTILMAVLLLAGCGSKTVIDNNETEDNTVNTNTDAITDNEEKPVENITVEVTTTVNNTIKETVSFNGTDYDTSVSKRDLSGSYDQITGTVSFSGSDVSVTGKNITVSGSTVKITAEGTYVLSGNGTATVIVETDSNSKVQIILNNLTLQGENNAAILIGQADKVFITLADNTVNTLSDPSSYTYTYDGTDVDAALFAKDDLTINGTGTLNVTGNKSHGIVCKDDLIIAGATVSVTSKNTAINGKDSVLLISATVSVNAGTDGIKSANDTDAGKGYIYINSSTVTAKATDKGLQATSAIIIDSGTISVTARDDGIHSDKDILINSGTLTVNSGDDGIHRDHTLEINDGMVTVKAGEGMEATIVTLNDGEVTINASDDGINAAKKVSGVTPCITINGGTLTINMGQGDTDALDSNGNLIINGGYISITAQFPFDWDGTAQLNGGTVIVNGSQVTQLTNQFGGGGQPGGGGFGPRG
ncbi:MAG: carbohydrate-binding domain-containing protein [Erysipelotrichaceae bacterium]|nr:carbohydrate-binding domain-containing protein [Erysipelotrichaceae bacterium]